MKGLFSIKYTRYPEDGNLLAGFLLSLKLLLALINGVRFRFINICITYNTNQIRKI